MNPPNLAAWQPEPVVPLELRPAPDPTPGEGQIVVRNAAVAINPIDWLLQEKAYFPHLTYPAILGCDVAGEVVAVGSGASRFRVGDRVIGQAVASSVNDPAEGGFQRYTVLRETVTSSIPDSLSFTDAVVLPLGLGTAACGLFERDQLALDLPTLGAGPNGKTLLVWGGASSVGCNGIQLAVAAGYEVVATASPKNFDLLRRLGAAETFDYHDPNSVETIVAALRGKTMVGALHTVGEPTCYHILARCEGRRFVSTSVQIPETRPEGVEANRIFGSTLKDNEVGPAVYGEFLPAALAAGNYVCAPEPIVIGHGLEAIQAGLDAQRAGVSARKVVVTL